MYIFNEKFSLLSFNSLLIRTSPRFCKEIIKLIKNNPKIEWSEIILNLNSRFSNRHKTLLEKITIEHINNYIKNSYFPLADIILGVDLDEENSFKNLIDKYGNRFIVIDAIKLKIFKENIKDIDLDLSYLCKVKNKENPSQILGKLSAGHDFYYSLIITKNIVNDIKCIIESLTEDELYIMETKYFNYSLKDISQIYTTLYVY